MLAYREAQGITQEELARLMGVSFATVNRWEAGKRSPQRAHAIKFYKLCRLCRIPLQQPHDPRMRNLVKEPRREYATTKGHYYAYDNVHVNEYDVERRYNDPPAPQPPPGDGWELKSTSVYLSDGVNFLWSWQRDV